MEPFSVLMSLYIKEKPEYFEECLISLKDQTLMPNEIIIILDGQITTALKSVIAKWKKCLPIKIISLDKNVGLGNALKLGLKNCTYRLIARMDTDDICHPQRFEKQILQFENDNDLVLVGGNICEFNEDFSIKISKKRVPISPQDIKKYAQFRNPLNHMTVMFDRYKIIDAGSYNHHLFMEDYNLWLRCLAKNYKMINLTEDLVYVRGGISMIRRRKGINYIKSEIQLYNIKKRLKIVSGIKGIKILIFRVLPRLMPQSLLFMLYKNR